MRIRSFVHKGLKRLYSGENAKGVAPDTVDKLRKILVYLDNVDAAAHEIFDVNLEDYH